MDRPEPTSCLIRLFAQPPDAGALYKVRIKEYDAAFVVLPTLGERRIIPYSPKALADFQTTFPGIVEVLFTDSTRLFREHNVNAICLVSHFAVQFGWEVL